MRTNPLSLSVTAANLIVGKNFYDLDNSIKMMQRLLETGVVDGFELQHLGEWDGREPPREDNGRRVAGWQTCAKYLVEQLAEILQATGLPILTIHANRDVGICLCSDEAQDIERGKTLMHESLWLAQQVGARASVFHLWDTWKKQFDPLFLQEVIAEIAPLYPTVKVAIENVPTHLAGKTPFDLVQAYDWLTLDLRWAALYDEFWHYEALLEKVANVHLTGVLGMDGRFSLNPAWFPEGHHIFTFDEAVETICGKWGYSGPLTVELYPLPESRWLNLVEAMKQLRI